MLFLKGSISSFLRSGPTGLPLPPTLLTPGHQPLSSQEVERRGRQLPLTLGKLWCSSQRRFRMEGEEQGSEARKVWGAKLFLGGSEPLRLFPWVPSQSPGGHKLFGHLCRCLQQAKGAKLYSLGPWNVTIYGERVFVDVIKLRMGGRDSPGFSRWL